MSNKHKKHKNSTNNNPNNMKETSIETTIVEEEIDEVEETVEESEEVELVEEDVVEEVCEAVNLPAAENNLPSNVTEAETTVVESELNIKVVQPTKPVVFYKVGTGFVHGKCANQIMSTSEFSLAKENCDLYRNTYKKTYYVFNHTGDVVYTSEYTIPKDNFYRVGTEWKNGMCINQKCICVNIDEAIESANMNTRVNGVVYSVYDPSGKVVFSAKKKLTLLSLKKRGNKDAGWYS